MIITEVLLLANGWGLWLFPDMFIKRLPQNVVLIAEFYKSSTRISLQVGQCIYLPNVRTMEQIAQLEYLLSDTRAASVQTLDNPPAG